jgi:hypothetical protein
MIREVRQPMPVFYDPRVRQPPHIRPAKTYILTVISLIPLRLFESACREFMAACAARRILLVSHWFLFAENPSR